MRHDEVQLRRVLRIREQGGDEVHEGCHARPARQHPDPPEAIPRERRAVHNDFFAPLTFIEAFWPGSSAQSHAPRPPPLRGV